MRIQQHPGEVSYIRNLDYEASVKHKTREQVVLGRRGDSFVGRMEKSAGAAKTPSTEARKAQMNSSRQQKALLPGKQGKF